MRKLSSKILFCVIVCSIFFTSSSCTNEKLEMNRPPELIDVDGNSYKTIIIGNQVWMAENLKTTRYNDGTPIINGDNNWSSTEGRYLWASTDDLNNAVAGPLSEDYYGVIYNFATIKTNKIAPTGWRIPTENDWNELFHHLEINGFLNNEGVALKSKSGWVSQGNGTDNFGFNGLPAGYVDTNGTPKADGIIANWAVNHQNNAFSFSTVNIIFDEDDILVTDTSVWLGVSIRCVKE